MISAILDGNIALIEYFINVENTNVNVRGIHFADTPLSIALALDHEEIIAILVVHGADYSMLNEEDRRKLVPILLKIFNYGPENFIEQKRKEREEREREERERDASRIRFEEIFGW
jgi:hypothetical protein